MNFTMAAASLTPGAVSTPEDTSTSGAPVASIAAATFPASYRALFHHITRVGKVVPAFPVLFAHM